MTIVVEASVKRSVEDLYRSQRPRLLRLGYLLTTDAQAAEDAVQDAFASLAQRWGDVERPEAYLRQTVVNRVNDHHRRGARPLVDDRPLAIDEPELDETWTLVQRLPPAQRAVVVLRFYEDLRLVDIALLLQRPESTVRSDLRRALLRMRSELSHE